MLSLHQDIIKGKSHTSFELQGTKLGRFIVSQLQNLRNGQLTMDISRYPADTRGAHDKLLGINSFQFRS
jgi:hypothetical protein